MKDTLKKWISTAMQYSCGKYLQGRPLEAVLTCRQVPFDGLLYFDILTRILTEKSRLEIPEDCPREYTQLMSDCWDEDPKKRPAFSQIIPRLEGFAKECESWSFAHIPM